MSMLNTEKPIIIVVRQSSEVFQNTLPLRSVANIPQKHRASSTAMKNTAPLLYGRPSTFTNSRSVYAASLGSTGIITNSISASMTTPTANILSQPQKFSLRSPILR